MQILLPIKQSVLWLRAFQTVIKNISTNARKSPTIHQYCNTTRKNLNNQLINHKTAFIKINSKYLNTNQPQVNFVIRQRWIAENINYISMQMPTIAALNVIGCLCHRNSSLIARQSSKTRRIRPINHNYLQCLPRLVVEYENWVLKALKKCRQQNWDIFALFIDISASESQEWLWS